MRKQCFFEPWRRGPMQTSRVALGDRHAKIKKLLRIAGGGIGQA
jgi:hypothetical protein